MMIRMKNDHTQVREAIPVETPLGDYIIRSGWTTILCHDSWEEVRIIPFSRQDWELVQEER